MKRILLATLTAGLLFASHAGEPPGIRFTAHAEIEVAANGTTRLLQIFDIERASRATAVQTKLKAELAKRIVTWKFEPALRNDVPVVVRTFLRVDQEALPQDDGSFQVRVLNATPGPRTITMTPPRYPRAALIKGVEGMVLLVLDVDATGKVSAAQVERVEMAIGQSALQGELRQSALAAAQTWTFANEVVAGESMPGRIRVPVVFCTSGEGECSAPQKAGSTLKPGQVVALDPAVRLITDVRG